VKVDVDQEQALASHLQARLPVTSSVFSCHVDSHIQAQTAGQAVLYASWFGAHICCKHAVHGS